MLMGCHPLREDVSWNISKLILAHACVVILFVRMWVEITAITFWTVTKQVILFVRMWVEMLCSIPYTYCMFRHPLREDVSWNVIGYRWITSNFRHPLREDVSWNMIFSRSSRTVNRHPLREDVSWNNIFSHCFVFLICHPLREDVSWNMLTETEKLTCSVILFVRMWVEIAVNPLCANTFNVILFVRMWVEISPFWNV